MDETAQRLLGSSARLSRDPETEIDWDAPLGDGYGLSPEWSTLYGTPYWDEMTRGAAGDADPARGGSVMSTGIWFEMILQQMILRDLYAKPTPPSPEFQFALTEIADECRHSIMFARACRDGRPGVPAARGARRAGPRCSRALATGETAYAAILVAEEVLDVMQRDWMRGERVVPLVRDDQPDPRGRGVAAHGVRPARRSASGWPACAGRAGAGVSALVDRDRRAT